MPPPYGIDLPRRKHRNNCRRYPLEIKGKTSAHPGEVIPLRRKGFAPNQHGRRANPSDRKEKEVEMIRKLKSGEYRLYSRKKDPRTGRRRNLGTFKSRAAAEKHERAVQYFKHH
jgi:hypothetical protein